MNRSSLRSRFRKEESTRSLPPSLEILFLKRYGGGCGGKGHNNQPQQRISPAYLDGVVSKGRVALGMRDDEDFTEKLQVWCHGFLQAQLADPAFLAAQRIHQIAQSSPSSSSNEQMPFGQGTNYNSRSVPSSLSRLGESMKEEEDDDDDEDDLPRTVDELVQKVLRADEMLLLQAKRENSRRSLLANKDQDSHPSNKSGMVLNIPKQPTRKHSDSESAARHLLEDAQQSTFQGLVPAEIIITSSGTSSKAVAATATLEAVLKLTTGRTCSSSEDKSSMNDDDGWTIESSCNDGGIQKSSSQSSATPPKKKSLPARGILPARDESYDCEGSDSDSEDGPSYLTATMGVVYQSLKKQQSEKTLQVELDSRRASMMQKQQSERTFTVSTAPHCLMKKQQSERALVASSSSSMRNLNAVEPTERFGISDKISTLPRVVMMRKQQSERSLVVESSSCRRLVPLPALMRQQQSEQNVVAASAFTKKDAPPMLKQSSAKSLFAPIPIVPSLERHDLASAFTKKDTPPMLKQSSQRSLLAPFPSMSSTERKLLAPAKDTPPMLKQSSERSLLAPVPSMSPSSRRNLLAATKDTPPMLKQSSERSLRVPIPSVSSSERNVKDTPPMLKQSSERSLIAPPIPPVSVKKQRPDPPATAPAPSDVEMTLNKQPPDLVLREPPAPSTTPEPVSIMKKQKSERCLLDGKSSKKKKKSKDSARDKSTEKDNRSELMKKQQSELSVMISEDPALLMKKQQSDRTLGFSDDPKLEKKKRVSTQTIDRRSAMKKQQSEKVVKTVDLRSLINKQQSEKTVKASGSRKTSKSKEEDPGKEKKPSKKEKKTPKKDKKKSKKDSSKEPQKDEPGGRRRYSKSKNSSLSKSCSSLPITTLTTTSDDADSYTSSVTFGTSMPHRTHDLTEELNVARWSPHPFRKESCQSKPKVRPSLISGRGLASYRGWSSARSQHEDDTPKLPKRTWDHSTRTLETEASDEGTSDCSVCEFEEFFL